MMNSSTLIFNERKGAWKILLPWNHSLIFLNGTDNNINLALSRNYKLSDSEEENDFSVTYKITRNNRIEICYGPASEEYKRTEMYYSIPQVYTPKLYLSLCSRSVFQKGLTYHTPGSFLGKTYLRLLYMLSYFAFPYLKSKANVIISSVHINWNGLYEKVSELLPEYSSVAGINIYNGSKAQNNKMTCQVIFQNEKEIIAKIADTKEGKDVLENETMILKTLENTKLKDRIPYLLSHKDFDDYYIQMQSKCVFNGKHPHNRMSKIVLHFLADMKELFKGESSGNAYVDAINNSSSYPPEILELCEKCRTIPLLKTSLCHGDFAPWNIYEKKSQIFVFDWEDSSISTEPSGIDLFHYLYRSQVLLCQWMGWDKFSVSMQYYCKQIGYENSWVDICRIGVLREFLKSGMTQPLKDCLTNLNRVHI